MRRGAKVCRHRMRSIIFQSCLNVDGTFFFFLKKRCEERRVEAVTKWRSNIHFVTEKKSLSNWSIYKMAKRRRSILKSSLTNTIRGSLFYLRNKGLRFTHEIYSPTATRLVLGREVWKESLKLHSTHGGCLVLDYIDGGNYLKTNYRISMLMGYYHTAEYIGSQRAFFPPTLWLDESIPMCWKAQYVESDN